jgi:hypothetical protein
MPTSPSSQSLFAMSDALTERDARRHLRRLIDEQIADRSDAMYTSQHYAVEELGRLAAQIFDKSQMNSLGRVALGASTFSEVANFIKSQCGRTTSTGEAWREDDFGYRLYELISGKVTGPVESNTENIITAMKEGGGWRALQQTDEKKDKFEKRLSDEISRSLRVGYAQAYISHMVAHFNFEKSLIM